MVINRSPVAMGSQVLAAISAMTSSLSGAMGSSKNRGVYGSTPLAKARASGTDMERWIPRIRSKSDPTASRQARTRSIWADIRLEKMLSSGPQVRWRASPVIISRAAVNPWALISRQALAISSGVN